MKKQTLLLTSLILLASYLFAQDGMPKHAKEHIISLEKNLHLEMENNNHQFLLNEQDADLKNRQIYKGTNSKEDIWVHDSIYNYAWNSELNEWVVTSKTTYTYNGNGYPTLRIIYNWNSELNDWVGYRKYETVWDANGNNTLWARYNWDSELNDWVGYYKFIFSYYENGNWLEDLYFEWNNEINDWALIFKNVYSWDNNGNNTGYI